MTEPRKYRAQPINPTHAGEDGFVYGWYIEQYFTPNSNRYFIFPNNREGKFLDQFIEVKKDTIGQSTGLKDKERYAEVYEHDQYRGKESGTIYTVVFKDGKYSLEYDAPTSGHPPIIFYHDISYALHNLDLEYRGTIHDKEGE